MKARPPLAELTGPYDGVVTQSALVSAGYPHSKASEAVAAGRWQRLLHGVYLTSPEPPTLRQRCHAAVLQAGERSVITGRAGCELRGITLPRSAAQEVTVLVPADRQPRGGPGYRVVRVGRLPDHQVLQRDGRAPLRVALAERCLADAVRAIESLDDATAVAAAGLRSPRVDAAAFLSQRRPGPGNGHLLRVADALQDGVRSAAERRVHEALLRAARRGHLPPYLLNPDLYLDGTLLGSPDAWFPGLGLGNEVDSREWHEEAALLDQTLQRHERFAGAGLHLLHITPSRFDADPRGHVRTLRAAVQERRSLPQSEPSGLVVLARGPLLPARTPWPQLARRVWG